MHVYVANSMELFNLIKNFASKNMQPSAKESKDSVNIVIFRILIPVLGIIAPQTIKKIKDKTLSQ